MSIMTTIMKDKEYSDLKKALKGNTVLDEYKLIKSKKSELSTDMKALVIGMIEEEQ